MPAEPHVTDTDRQHRRRQRIVICVACVFVAALLHLVIRQYYPANIDRSKWLVAFGLLAARNGFVGAAIGAIFGHAGFGAAIGLMVPPVVLVMLYGLPG